MIVTIRTYEFYLPVPRHGEQLHATCLRRVGLVASFIRTK